MGPAIAPFVLGPPVARPVVRRIVVVAICVLPPKGEQTPPVLAVTPHLDIDLLDSAAASYVGPIADLAWMVAGCVRMVRPAPTSSRTYLPPGRTGSGAFALRTRSPLYQDSFRLALADATCAVLGAGSRWCG